jgi:hypothetical protein
MAPLLAGLVGLSLPAAAESPQKPRALPTEAKA